MERHEIIQSYIEIFGNTMHEVESLEEFYHRSLLTYKDYYNKSIDEYKVGLTICNLFDSVLDKDNIEEKNKRIDEILNEKINENLILQDICTIEKYTENKNVLRYSMLDRYFSNIYYSPIAAKLKLQSAGKYKKILVESVISHIIVVFENFLGNILRILIKKEPLKYLANQQIMISEVIQKGEESISEKIEQTVDSYLRCSIDQLSEIEKKEKIEIDRYEKISTSFSEVYYRRNAYIHTDGKVNKDYLNKVDNIYKKNIQIGNELVCDKDYLDNSICLLSKIIFSIVFELLKNTNVNAIEMSYITNYYFVRLLNEHYPICKFVYQSLSQYKPIEFADKMNFRINYLNACKQLGETEFVNKKLKELDISAMEDKYKIAKYCLANETEKIYSLLKSTYPHSFNALEIREWPIFINFRETKEYQQFRNEHLEDFLVNEMEADDNTKQPKDESSINLEDLIEKPE